MEEDIPLVHKFEPFKPQPIDERFSTKKPKKNVFSVIWRLIKKYKFVIIIVAVVTGILMALYISIPVVPVAQYRFVNEGTPVRLEMNQKAKLKYSNVSVEISRFNNATCPVGKQCYGSGQFVNYDLRVENVQFAPTSLTSNVRIQRYQVKTLKTDNKTFAEIKIIKS